MEEQPAPKRIFVKKTISARLKCPICYDVYTKPRRLFCGHTYCKDCLKQLFKPHKNPQHTPSCPMCRVVIDTNNIGYDLIAIKIIDGLEVMCPVRGCPWRGQNQLLETHYNYQCRMKQYFTSINGQIQIVDEEDHDEEQQEVAERINENMQKGNLISRVISKNPHLISFKTVEVDHDEPEVKAVNYKQETKTMISISTQTPVKISKRTDKAYYNRIQQKQLSTPRAHLSSKQPPFRNTDSSESIYSVPRPKIDIINLEDKYQRVIKTRRSRPRIFRN